MKISENAVKIKKGDPGYGEPIGLTKQRGDKAKEWAKKASKAKSAISSANHFMSISDSLSEEITLQAKELISEIEMLLDANENTKAASRGEKLNKLFN